MIRWKQLDLNDSNYETNLEPLNETTKEIQTLAYLKFKELCTAYGAKWNTKIKNRLTTYRGGYLQPLR
jgi:hypothetical protein